MANATEPGSQEYGSQLLQEPVYVTILSFVIGILAILFNAKEIQLITKQFRKATDFEVLLLNLAVADLSSGVMFLVVAAINTYIHAKNIVTDQLFMPLMLIFGFFVTLSWQCVITIGVERFLAVKQPLKHRARHMSKRTLVIQVFATWMFSVVFILTSWLVNDFVYQSKYVSKGMAYISAVYLTLEAVIVVIIYGWVAYIIVKQSSKFLKFDAADYRRDASAVKEAFKKEKSSITVCALVVLTFLPCNIPLTVSLYTMNMNNPSTVLVRLNSVINPLLYFYKNFVEKNCKRFVVNSTQSEFVYKRKIKTKETIVNETENEKTENTELGQVNNGSFGRNGVTESK